MRTLTILSLAALPMGAILASATAWAAEGSGGPLRLLSAYYMPDAQPPAQTNQVEGDPKPPQYGAIFASLQAIHEQYAEFGGARIVVHNASDSPVHIDGVRLDGKPLEDHYVDFLNGNWDDRGVVWYRVRPETLAPGEAGEIYIRFRRRPAGAQATAQVDLRDGSSLETIIEFTEPGVQVDYVTTDESRRRLYVYARRQGKAPIGNLRSISLDGKPLQNVTIYGAGFPGNVALAVAELPVPLRIGDYHVVQVDTSGGLFRRGRSVAAQFRVLPFMYMRWSFLYRASSPEEVREVGMNFVDWRQDLTLEQAEELDVYNSAANHERRIWQYMYDEPDAKDQHPDFGAEQITRFLRQELGYDDDPLEMAAFRQQYPLYTGLGYAVGLGRLARDNILARNRQVEQEQFPVATYLITNGTTRPLNWFVYGQLTDIAGTDPYPVNFYGGDLPTVREQYKLMRQAAAPRPTYACLESYTNTVYLDEAPDALRRAPSAPEFRQMAVQALGCGVKGHTSWFWATGSGMTGAGHIPHLRAEYIRLNKLTQHIETELLLSTHVDIVTNDAGLTPTGSFYFLEDGPYKQDEPWMKERVWTGALLCGPDAIIIAAAHHLPASRMTPDHIEPARDVNITVQLPAFLRDVECFEVDDAGLHPYPCRVRWGKALLTLDEIESGRIFLLRRR